MPKGLIPWNGTPWILHQLRSYDGPVTVVLGHDREKYLAAVPELADRHVINPDPDRGQFSSIQTGLQAVGGAAFLLPVDVPAPAPAVWSALERALSGPVDAVVPVFDGKGGHPVLISQSFNRRLLTLSADHRLDAAIHALAPEAVRRVEVEDGRVTANVNTPDDLARLGR
jgi:molybdenum cofactor cytidylyltransferase